MSIGDKSKALTLSSEKQTVDNFLIRKIIGYFLKT